MTVGNAVCIKHLLLLYSLQQAICDTDLHLRFFKKIIHTVERKQYVVFSVLKIRFYRIELAIIFVIIKYTNILVH